MVHQQATIQAWDVRANQKDHILTSSLRETVNSTADPPVINCSQQIIN